MTHTRAAPRLANALPRHVAPEAFRDFAGDDLTAAPPWQPGVCFNAGCGAAFTPARDWQVYCCKACERAGVAEMRRWGHRAALALLVWRLGKYAPPGPQRTAARSARRYLTQLQSAWLAERAALAAKGGRSC